MNESVGLDHTRALLAALFVAAALALAGCGESELCAEVDCDFGECEAQTGECVNAEDCRRHDECLPGYECRDFACQALSECGDDADCEVGVCEGGVCVNPSRCETNEDCLERTFCGPDHICEPDPCNDTTCPRGVCKRGTDDCVSADSCSEETAIIDCVEGEKCAGGTCEPEETFCEQLECERGVCSFEEGGCANADDCGGDDALCEEGFFCNDQNDCQIDECEELDVTCGDGGRCVPATGKCENPETCAVDADCRPDHRCVDATCRHEDSVCGDGDGEGGCRGNQRCEVSADEAVCHEPEVCETSFDCLEDRQCGGRDCIEPVSCADDYFEPNDDAQEATAFLEVAPANTVEATLCRGDVDVYTFDSAEIVDRSQRGALVVELDVPRRNRGLGELELALIEPEGGSEQTVDNGRLGAEGKLRLEESLNVLDHSEFTVEVRAKDEMNRAGVGYELSVNLVPEETVEACEAAEALPLDRRVSGDTVEATSSFLGSSCTSRFNGASERIYAFEVDAPQEVEIRLDPLLSGADFSMSLRKECLQPASEQRCADARDAGHSETLTALLGAGTYYLIVQSADGATGGAFELNVDTVYTSCSRDGNHCEGGDIAQMCAPDGGQFREVECDRGCNPATGRCFPPPGDSCLDAPVLEPSGDFGQGDGDDSESFFESFELLQLSNSYEPTSDVGCFGSRGRADGPEMVYQVELPSKTAISAELVFADEVIGSMYLVENCADLEDSCLAGSARSVRAMSSEEVGYGNFSDEAQTLFLIVDTAAGQALSTADLEVTFSEMSCEPAHDRCNAAGDVETCDRLGIDYETSDECADFPCQDGVCLTGASCSNAAIAGDGDSFRSFYDGGNDLDPVGDGEAGTCWLAGSSGDERVYEVDLSEGEVLTASYDDGYSGSQGAYRDTVMYLLGDCANASSCRAATDIGETGALSYLAEQDETVYVVVDSTSTAQVDYSYQVHIDVDSAECVPDDGAPSCQGGDVVYCGDDYKWHTYDCGGRGCVGGTCASGTADNCFEAPNLTSEARQPNGASRTLSWDDFTNQMSRHGTCGLYNSYIDGGDAFYEFDLQEGEVLEASLDPNDSSRDPALVITRDCQSPHSACLEGARQFNNPAELTYLAPRDETVYLIADAYRWGTDDDFDLDVEIRDAQCDPLADAASCANADDLEYCSGDGAWEQFSCLGSCSNDACVVASGEVCADARTIGDGGSDKRYFDAGVHFLETGYGMRGDCFFDAESAGRSAERFYRINLDAGDTLEVTYTTGVDGRATDDGRMYLLDECGDADTCLLNKGPIKESEQPYTLSHTADEDGPVYLVVSWSNRTTTVYDYQIDVDIR